MRRFMPAIGLILIVSAIPTVVFGFQIYPFFGVQDAISGPCDLLFFECIRTCPTLALDVDLPQGGAGFQPAAASQAASSVGNQNAHHG
jgi:hypothetical protein